jgi:hypothetical protein
VAVVGGGLTGVEVSTEIAEAYPALSVTLLSAAELGGGLSVRGREYLLKAMERHGVELRERTRVKEVGRGALKFADGEEVPANVVVWAAGFAVPDLARRSGLATDGRGRVLVDASLRSVSHPNVFAAGDSAWPVEPVGAGAAQRVHRDHHRRPRRGQRRAGARREAHQAAELRLRDPIHKPGARGRARAVHRRVRRALRMGRHRPVGREDQGRRGALRRRRPLRLERLVPGVFAWRPAPRARGGSVEDSAGNA